MSRPSRNTDKLLIQAARDLLPETGATGLNLRQVAARAGVNLGMFHYHFKTRRVFVAAVLQEVYEDFFAKFSLEHQDIEDPLEALKRVLTMFAKFIRENRGLLLMLIRDVLNGDKEVTRFAQANIMRHVSVITGLVEQCQKKKQVINGPTETLLPMILGTVGVPNIIAEVARRAGARRPLGKFPKQFEDAVLSDEAIAMRIKLLLRSIEV